jgi:hypothetical protein
MAAVWMEDGVVQWLALDPEVAVALSVRASGEGRRGAEAHCQRGEFDRRRPLGCEMVRQAAAGALIPR